jgi:hypothetical protein
MSQDVSHTARQEATLPAYHSFTNHSTDNVDNLIKNYTIITKLESERVQYIGANLFHIRSMGPIFLHFFFLWGKFKGQREQQQFWFWRRFEIKYSECYHLLWWYYLQLIYAVNTKLISKSPLGRCTVLLKKFKMCITDFVSQSCLIWMYTCICFVAFRANDALTPCFWENRIKYILVHVSNRAPIFLALLSTCFMRVIFLSKMEHVLETCRFWSRWRSIFSFQFTTHLVGSPIHISILHKQAMMQW